MSIIMFCFFYAIYFNFISSIIASLLNELINLGQGFWDITVNNPILGLFIILKIQFGILFLGSGLIYCIQGMFAYNKVLLKRKTAKLERFRLTIVDFCLVASVAFNVPGIVFLFNWPS